MNLFFKIFKPANPIHWDGINISEHSVNKKINELFRNYILKRNFSLEFFNRLLIILKESILNVLILVYLPISLIFFIFNFRFLWINTWQLGAYLQQLDSITKENSILKEHKLIFLCPKFLLINNFIHKLYRRNIFINENFFVYLLLYPCIHTWFLKKTSWRFETVKKNNEFNYINFKYKKKFKKYYFNFPELENELKIKRDLIKKLGIKKLKQVIIVHQRDEFFYNSPNTRNSKIDNLYESLSYLISKGFFIIRYKSKNSKSLSLDNKFYKELTIENEDDKIRQYILIKNCKLVICYQGGIIGYDYICKTPFLLINAIPFNINALIKNSDRLILKKFYSEKKKSFLSVKEIIDKDLHIKIDFNFLRKKKIKIVENSSKEILLAIKEIINLKKLKENKKMERYFPDQFPFLYSDAQICNMFINRNPGMFKLLN